jgi:hypothetical protein
MSAQVCGVGNQKYYRYLLNCSAREAKGGHVMPASSATLKV